MYVYKADQKLYSYKMQAFQNFTLNEPPNLNDTLC